MSKNMRKKARRRQKSISVLLKSKDKNVHKSLRVIFAIAQVFGLFPIQGVLSTEPTSVSFKWFSLRILSSTLTYTSGFLVALSHMRYVIICGYNEFEISRIFFYISGSLSCIFFIKMALDWPTLVLEWHKLDKAMTSYGWPKKLDRRLKIISTIFLLLETAEHFSKEIYKLIVAVECEGSVAKGFEHFTVNMSFPQLFDVIKPYYDVWLGILLQFVNTRMAFSWTFNDLFIILISCVLAMRFEQINYRVRSMIDMKVKSERSWGSINEDYNRLCKLCRFLDDKMSFLILISFFNNFFKLTFHIYESLDLHKATALETVYYFISLGLLILRFYLICFYASWIHEESKRSVDLISSSSHEIVKFMEIIQCQNTGLTGKGFFTITKQLVLKIATAVVTYELLIIQFSVRRKSNETPSKSLVY